MDIHVAAPDDYPACDAFLDRRDVPPLHRSAWLTALADAYGVRTAMYIARDAAGAIRGVCSTYMVDEPRGSGRCYSLRHGFVADDDAAAAALADAVVTAARDAGAPSVLLSSGTHRVPLSYAAIPKQTLQLAVPSGADAAWASLRNKTRNMVRKSERSGVRVLERRERLRAFYDGYAARMVRKGVPIHRYEFFTALVAAFDDRAEVLVAQRGVAVLGGMLLLTGTRSAAYPFQATRPGTEAYAPTALLTWEAVRRCAARGISTLDMGESMVGSSTERAKVFFGGTQTPVWYYAAGSAAPPAPRASALAMRAASLGMRYAPAWVGQYCGVWMKRRGRLI